MTTEQRMTIAAMRKLVGRKIVRVEYLDDDVASEQLFYKRPIIIHLDDGSFFVPIKDDEMNDGGSLYYEKKNKFEIIPTIS